MVRFVIFILRVWFNFPEKIRFLLVGGFNTVVSYLMFASFIFVLGKPRYQLSLVLAWILSSFISFSTQKIFVFQTKGKWYHEYVKCLLTWSVGYLINACTLELAIKLLHLNIYIGQAVSILLTTVITYILFKHFAFKGEKND